MPNLPLQNSPRLPSVLAWVVHNPRTGGIVRITTQALRPPVEWGLVVIQVSIPGAALRNPASHRVRAGAVIRRIGAGIGTSSLV